MVSPLLGKAEQKNSPAGQKEDRAAKNNLYRPPVSGDNIRACPVAVPPARIKCFCLYLQQEKPAKMKTPVLFTAVSELLTAGFIFWLGLAGPGLAEGQPVLLQSTTSTQNSGLYDHILPGFTADTGIDVHVVAVGSGQALRNAANCDGDVVLAHAPEDEQAFIDSGYGLTRRQVMENHFVLLGPADDPAAVSTAQTITEALQRIAAAKARFLSRGDNSGTHQRERRLWRAAGTDITAADASWYLEAGQGMGASINLAVQLGGYLLSDRATWLAFSNKAGHRLVYQSAEAELVNRYSVITLNPAHCPTVNHDGAQRFSDWLVSADGQARIAGYRLDGQQMFSPAAEPPQ